jgi:hypothetical protein
VRVALQRQVGDDQRFGRALAAVLDRAAGAGVDRRYCRLRRAAVGGDPENAEAEQQQGRESENRMAEADGNSATLVAGAATGGTGC